MGTAQLKIGKEVEIGRNVMIRVRDGGTLTIADGTSIGDACRIMVSGHLAIGKNNLITEGVILFCQGNMTIGADCMMAPYCLLIDHHHATDRLDVPMRLQGITPPKAVNIGSDVWLGTKVSVMPGVTIGNGAVVGANGVVTKDVAPLTIVVGSPAKFLKSRIPDNSGC